MESPFASLIISVVLKAAIIIIALQIALNKTKSLSGAAGQWATKAGTAVFGAAVGTAAFAGRHTISRAAKGFRDSDTGKRFIAKTGVAGEYLDRGLGAVAGGTMDIRGIPGMDKAGLGRPANKGGYDKYQSEQTKRKVELGKRLGKDKFGNALHELAVEQQAISYVGKDEKGRDTSRTMDIHKGERVPKTFTDKYGKVRLVEKDGETQYRTATDTYVDRLAKEKKVYFMKKSGYKQSGADRAAAVALRKKEPNKEELKKYLEEAGVLEKGGAEGETPKTPKEGVSKESETPKEPEKSKES